MLVIDKLTTQQEAMISVYRDKWTGIGLSTEPASRLRAEKAINSLYNQAGLAKPHIVWTTSPLVSGLAQSISSSDFARGLAKNLVQFSIKDLIEDHVWNSIESSVWASVEDSVKNSVSHLSRASTKDSTWASVWKSVKYSVYVPDENSVWKSINTFVMNPAWSTVWSSIRVPIKDSIWNFVGASVWASIRDSIQNLAENSILASAKDSSWNSGYGQHDAHWVAFFSFFRDVYGMFQDEQKITQYVELAQSANWYLPCAGVCYVSERPHTLHRDEDGRLHCENGPALAYRDGFGVWSWHGVRVPRFVIEQPNQITIKTIDTEDNAEVRRVMLLQYGEERYIRDSGLEPIHEDQYGTLYKKTFAGDEPLAMVRVINGSTEPDGTRRIYWLRVPPDVRTAHEAVAWTYWEEPDEYQPDIRT